MPFNYESKLCGINEVDLQPKFLGATRLKYCLKALKKVSQGKVLEIGCGGGAFSRAIKKHRPEFKIVGSDISHKALQAAREIDGGVKYQEADVYDLSFKNNSFEAAVSFDVWEHLEKPQKAFKEVFRVLKPGGIFHFFAPLEGSSLSLYQLLPKIFYKNKKEYTGHVQSYTEKELFKLLSKAGFRIKKVDFSCFYFYQIIDLSYFLFLKLRGRNAAASVEGYLQFSKGSLFDKFLTSLKTLFGWLFYIENEIFKFLPRAASKAMAGGIHITVISKE